MATKKRDLKKKCRNEMITYTILEGILLLYFGLVLGAAYINVPPEALFDQETFTPTFVDAILYLPEYIIANPLGVWPTHILGIGTAAIIWMIMFMYNYQAYLRKYNTMYEGAQGTAEFNSNLKSFLYHFVLDPKLITPESKIKFIIFDIVKSAIISIGVGILTVYVLKLFPLNHIYLLGVWIALFLIFFLFDIFRKPTKNVGQGKNITTKKLRYGIEKKSKVGPVTSFLCKITPNTVQPKELDACMENSFIESQEVRLSLNGPWCQRTTSSIVFGVPGTGKSRYLVFPNLLQANSSFIVTDPKGELLMNTGNFLRNVKGYKVKVLNLQDLSKTMRYNPLHYIRKEQDIPKVVTTILDNIDGPNKKSGGENGGFWDQATQNIFMAVVGYMHEVYTEKNEFLLDENGSEVIGEDGQKISNPYWEGHKNLINVVNMLRMSNVSEDGTETISELDALFAELAEKNRNSFAVDQYRTFKINSGKTTLNVLISALVKLNLFDNHDFQNVVYKDELDLYNIANEKTALFVVLPVKDTTFNFLSAILFTQIIDLLYIQGNASGGKLPRPVQFLLDEAANIGKIPGLDSTLSTCRSYRISIMMVFQTLAQVKNYDKDNYGTLLSAVDSIIYLGSTEQELLKFLSDQLGKTTVNTYSYGSSKNGSSDNRQQVGRPLLEASEIAMMDNADSLIFVRQQAPFFTPKFHLEEHKNYKYYGESGHKKGVQFFIEDEFYIEYDEDSIRHSFIKAYSDPKHTVPRLLDKYKDKDGNPTPLPIENFSRTMDAKAVKISGGAIKSWKDMIKTEGASEQTPEQENPTSQFDPSKYAHFCNVNELDKANIQKKLEAMSDKRFINISEDEYKMLVNVIAEVPDEEVARWCMENLQVADSFSASYEFEPETDFLINDFDEETDTSVVEENVIKESINDEHEFTDADLYADVEDNDEMQLPFSDDDFIDNITGDYE